MKFFVQFKKLYLKKAANETDGVYIYIYLYI